MPSPQASLRCQGNKPHLHQKVTWDVRQEVTWERSCCFLSLPETLHSPAVPLSGDLWEKMVHVRPDTHTNIHTCINTQTHTDKHTHTYKHINIPRYTHAHNLIHEVKVKKIKQKDAQWKEYKNTLQLRSDWMCVCISVFASAGYAQIWRVSVR